MDYDLFRLVILLPAQRGFEDTHVMIFIGFAFLMTFLKKYCYSALGYNWFLAALVIQWALLCQSFFHMKNNTIQITKKSLLEADIMSATVLITFGALLGLASGTQLLFLAIIETAVGCINLYLIESVYKASDIGGSIAIHTYGAYFGLGVSTAFRLRKPTGPEAAGTERLDGPTYISDITAMIGSIFLWIYWPSFNSGLAHSDAEGQRAIINTYLSLAAATVTTFVLSAMVSHKPGKLDMVHIQNSTLAGGVGVGAVANMFIGPGPYLEKIGIQDTCGVHNLHGAPGVYSGRQIECDAGTISVDSSCDYAGTVIWYGFHFRFDRENEVVHAPGGTPAIQRRRKLGTALT
ncbi:hypothetical protein HF086_013720 [Spodoptera exigua]|uniref:Ammonium transporter AmtB-like domain-containing protein n=1 Tax=Spodoptera exigua TaxID=7107 RepID=A0A922SF50_SPOEX|nr:hypothetical protein HF086_013720 [Spodoptera exigua]